MSFFLDGSSRHLTYFDQRKEDEGYAASSESNPAQLCPSHSIILKITPVMIIYSGGLNRREHDKTLQMKSADIKGKAHCLLDAYIV